MARMARIRRVIFAHHANPWSAWTRWASTSLVLVPVWTRRRSHAVLIGAWLTINPLVCPKVTDQHNWATRAMLGEELWITDRPRDSATVFSIVTSVAAVIAIVAARRHRLTPAVAATTVQMALTLVYWEQVTSLTTGTGNVETVPDEPTSSAADPDVDPGYTSSGVPTFEAVREKIETRYETSIGAAELDAESPEGRGIEEQYRERERAAAERLAEIRKSMHKETH